MAAAAGGVPPAPGNPLGVPTIRHYTFASDYFNDPSKDPYNGSYQALMSPFLIDINNPARVQPAVVRAMVAAATNNQEALLFCILHGGKTRSYLCPQKMENTVGTQFPTHLVNKYIAFDGDLHPNNGVNVELSNGMFDLLNNQVLVPTVDHITAQLAADATIEMFGPFQAGDANTQVARTRSIIVIPFRYSQLFLTYKQHQNTILKPFIHK